MYETILAFILSLAPRTPDARAQPIARAIEQAAEDKYEAAQLVVLSYYETGMGRAGAPFGVLSRRPQDRTLDGAASAAVRALRWARQVCGESLPVRFGFFRTGRCTSNAITRRQTATVRRLVRQSDRAER